MDWGRFLSAFGLVFVAELGDKTQLAVMTQTCKHRTPWAVFAGASAALVVVTALGAVGGQVLGRLIPNSVLRTVAALAFLVMGALIAPACKPPMACVVHGRGAWPGRWRRNTRSILPARRPPQ